MSPRKGHDYEFGVGKAMRKAGTLVTFQEERLAVLQCRIAIKLR